MELLVISLIKEQLAKREGKFYPIDTQRSTQLPPEVVQGPQMVHTFLAPFPSKFPAMLKCEHI